jgi:hypothetical protein
MKKNEWLEACREQGMFVLVGDAADATLLRQARVEQARGLFAVCDDDGVNAEIAVRTQRVVQSRQGQPLLCLVHVSDPQLCSLLRDKESRLERGSFRLELFNVFERGARRLLTEFPARDTNQLQTGKATHLLVVGLGRMGENLVVHAASDWCDQTPLPGQRLRITVIDREALNSVESLCIRCPQVATACEILPLEMDVHSPEFERAAFLLDEQRNACIDRSYICLDDDSLGQASAAELPITIRMAEDNGLARPLEDRKNHLEAYHNLFAFSLLDHTCTPDLLNNIKA